MQELGELLRWLEDELSLDSDAFADLTSDTAALQALRPQPTLAVAKANLEALQEVLHMRRAQVRWCTCRRCASAL